MSADTILVDRVPGETRVAALADGRLVDLAVARGDPRVAVGAILLGRVAQIVPGFDGAFIDIGLERAAFLRLSDAPAGLRVGDAVTVQIVRAVAGEKGLGVTARPRIAGRWVDYTPGRPGLRSVRGAPPPVGDLGLLAEEGADLRASVAAAPGSAIADEIARQRAAWATIGGAAGRAAAPASLWPAPDPWLAIAAHHGASIQTIAFGARGDLVDAQRTARMMMPDLADRLALDPAGARLFEAHGVEEEIAAALRRRVPLRGGGTLTVDEAEAVTLIDVDAGSSRSGPHAINRVAIPAIAAALRLRSIGGQVMVDLVREGGGKAREEIVQSMRAATADDPEPVEIAGWSRLGLLEMTRRRSRPSLASLLSVAPGDRPASGTARGYDALRAAVREAGAGVTGLVIECGAAVAAALRSELEGDRAALADRLAVSIEIAAEPSLASGDFRIRRGAV